MPDLPKEAVETVAGRIAHRDKHKIKGSWRRFAEGDLQAAAPAIRKQRDEELEDQRCGSCDGTGIYEEGDEWAPCEECEIGRGFLERLKTHAAEVRHQRDEELRERLDKLNLYRCPHHGLIDGAHYREGEWAPEDGCPLLTADEEECEMPVERFSLGPIFKNSDA